LIKKSQEKTLALLEDLRNNGVVDNKEKVFPDFVIASPKNFH